MRKEQEKSIYTAWSLQDETGACMLVGGEEPLTFNDGIIDPECQKKSYTITACTPRA